MFLDVLKAPWRRALRPVRAFANSAAIAVSPSRLAAANQIARDLLPARLGHADIDREHRSLAAKAGTLRVAHFHGDDPLEVEALVRELIDAMIQHVQDEVDALARLGVARPDDEVEADRRRAANAQYDFHLYRTGDLPLDPLVERVTLPLVDEHLRCRHPALPSLEAALRRLRDAQA